MDRTEYEENKGVTEQDAAVQEEEVEEEPIDQVESEEVEEVEEVEQQETDDEDDDLPEIPKEQNEAFQKRLERERKKLREQLESEVESKYSRHKQLIDMMGGDPDKIEQAIQENNRIAKANKMAEQNGWDEEQTKYYLNEQRKDDEVQELRTQVEINDLKDDPNYAGIGAMKTDIMSKVRQTGNTLSVKEAYWALGGEKRALQLKRETEQRAAVKRTKKKRTVQSDSSTAQASEPLLSPEDEKMRKRMGISATEAKKLMKDDGPKNLQEFRQSKGG